MKKITLLLLMVFSSFLGVAQVALSEGFEGTSTPASGTWALGSGSWAVFDNGVGTQISWAATSAPALIHQGSRAALMNGTVDNLGIGNVSQDWLVTPAVTAPSNGQLRFFTRQQTAGNQGSIFQIRISTTSQTDASTFTLLQEWNELNLNTTFNEYQEKAVSLNVPAGTTVYVAFVLINTQIANAPSSERWLVDTVSILEQCIDPTNLGNGAITPTTASLTWDNPGGASSWEIEIVPAATPTPSGHGVVYNGNSPYASTGTATGSPLVQTPYVGGQEYKYYIRALCANSNSNWVGPFNFTVSQVGETCSSAIQIPSLPYSTTDDTANYSDTVEGAPGTSCGATFSYLNGNDVFYAYTATETGIINITMTPTGSYSGIFVYNSCANVGVSCIAGVGNSGTGIREIPALAVTAGQTYIIVISTWASPQTTPYTLLIQKVNCTPPTNLGATGFGQTSATLSWGNPGNLATSWEVDVQTANTPIPSGAGVTTTNNLTYPAGGLTSGTAYRFYVRADCGDGTFSAWAGPYFFNTTVCDAVNQCNYSFVMTDEFGDGWNGNTMSVRQNGVVVATIGATFTTGEGPVTVTVPLCNGIPFELFWNSGGSFASEVGIQVIDAYEEDVYTKLPGEGTQNSLLYTGLVNCTPPTCPKPQALAVLSTTLTTAVLDWNEMGGATSWEVVYQPAGTNTPTGTSIIVNTPPPYTLEGLTSGTAYSFFVRALCSTTDFSNWSGPRNFSTAIENDECAAAVVVPVNPDLVCAQTASGILIGATESPETNDCFGNSDDDVWFEFVATATSHTIGLINVSGSTTDLVHVLYEGDQCGALTQLYCSNTFNNSSQANGLTIGNTYKIRVYSWSSSPQTTSFDICIRTPQPPIAVNGTQYTMQQLIQDVLIGSDCAIVTNVTSSTGTDFGQSNGIGYFDQNGSNFPFENGVVLATGNISEAEGPYPGNSDTFDTSVWPGDDELNALIVPGGNTAGLNNASILEFDFVPLTNQISFDFLFASNEYGTFQCNYSDAFAFILTDSNGASQNLAVIPGTNIPVSVVNIRDNANNPSCGSANVEYFGQYNVDDPEASAIGYGGQTVVMTAQAPVIVGQTYHIKLVIADYQDSSVNSAVFLKGGSFDIGDIDLGVDLTVAGGNAVCGGESYTIESGLDPDDYDFTWTDENGAVIPGQTGPNLEVTETGTYTISAAFTGSTCSVTAEIRIEFYDEIEVITGEPDDLVACDPSGFSTFDLSTNTTLLLAGLTASEYDVSYHLSQADAEANVGDLPLTYTNVVPNLQPIFIRILNNVTGCIGYKTFDLIVQDLTPQFTLTDDFSLCEGTSGTITVTPTNFNASDVTFTWTVDGGSPLPDTGSTITVSTAGFYEVTINNNGCSASDGTTVLVTPVPVADVISDQIVCENYTLPTLSTGNAYFTAENGAGSQLAAGTVISQTQTIYIYAQSGTNSDCTDQSSFLVTVVPSVDAIVDGSCDGSEYTMEVLPVNSSYDASTAIYSWATASDPAVILGTQQSLVVTQTGDYVVNVTVGGVTGCTYSFNFTANGTTCNIQKGISPNGDGKNDNFDLSGLQVRKISIFNRYGKIVYEFSNYTN
ncbi:choice-of-anchor L domain-containing protein, partial [Flavobacterium qiangtangense]